VLYSKVVLPQFKALSSMRRNYQQAADWCLWTHPDMTLKVWSGRWPAALRLLRLPRAGDPQRGIR
jgi:hypothetical protein